MKEGLLVVNVYVPFQGAFVLVGTVPCTVNETLEETKAGLVGVLKLKVPSGAIVPVSEPPSDTIGIEFPHM